MKFSRSAKSRLLRFKADNNKIVINPTTHRMKFRCLLIGAALLVGAALPAFAQTVTLTALDSAYTQNFDTLSNTAATTTNNLTITGWYMTESGGGTRDNEQYAVDTGGANTGDTYSYGSTGSTDRALGSVRSGTLSAVFGASFTNSTASTITSLTIAYRGEEWRLGNTGRTDKLAFEYSLDATSLTTGTWTAVTALDFTTPVTTVTGAKDGNAVANYLDLNATVASLSIANGSTFWIRWNDTDASGADDGLAVDNFSLTASGASAVPEPSTYAAIFGGLALVGVIVRGRRLGRA